MEGSHSPFASFSGMGNGSSGILLAIPPRAHTQPMSTFYPGRHDLLLGRGGETNNHSGNIKFRRLIEEYKSTYQSAPKGQKPEIAQMLVDHWRALDPPGRFLAKSPDNEDLWLDIGDVAARRRASKSLGEKTRRSMVADAVGDSNSMMLPPFPVSLKRKSEVLVQDISASNSANKSLRPTNPQQEDGVTADNISTLISERLFGSMSAKPNNTAKKPAPSAGVIVYPTTTSRNINCGNRASGNALGGGATSTSAVRIPTNFDLSAIQTAQAALCSDNRAVSANASVWVNSCKTTASASATSATATTGNPQQKSVPVSQQPSFALPQDASDFLLQLQQQQQQQKSTVVSQQPSLALPQETSDLPQVTSELLVQLQRRQQQQQKSIDVSQQPLFALPQDTSDRMLELQLELQRQRQQQVRRIIDVSQQPSFALPQETEQQPQRLRKVHQPQDQQMQTSAQQLGLERVLVDEIPTAEELTADIFHSDGSSSESGSVGGEDDASACTTCNDDGGITIKEV